MAFSKHKCLGRKRMSKKTTTRKICTSSRAKLDVCIGNSTQATRNLLNNSLVNIKQSTIDQFPSKSSLYVKYLCKNNIK